MTAVIVDQGAVSAKAYRRWTTNLRHEANGIEVGRQARRDPANRRWRCSSATYLNVTYFTYATAQDGLVTFGCTCRAAQRRIEAGMTFCWHTGRVAHQLARHALVALSWDDGRWHTTPKVARVLTRADLSQRTGDE